MGWGTVLGARAGTGSVEELVLLAGVCVEITLFAKVLIL